MDDIFEFILLSTIVAVVFIIVLSVMDYTFGTDKSMTGIVIDKAYTASSTNTGVGPAVGGNGGVAVVVTSTPEKYTLFVKQDNGEVSKISVDGNKWLSVKTGDKVNYTVRIGKWSGAQMR